MYRRLLVFPRARVHRPTRPMWLCGPRWSCLRQRRRGRRRRRRLSPVIRAGWCLRGRGVRTYSRCGRETGSGEWPSSSCGRGWCSRFSWSRSRAA